MNYMGLSINAKPSMTSQCTQNKICTHSSGPRGPSWIPCFASSASFCNLIPPHYLYSRNWAHLLPFSSSDAPNSFLYPSFLHTSSDAQSILFALLFSLVLETAAKMLTSAGTSTEYLNLKYVPAPPCPIIFSHSTLFFSFIGLFTIFNCIFRYSIMPISTTTLQQLEDQGTLDKLLQAQRKELSKIYCSFCSYKKG